MLEKLGLTGEEWGAANVEEFGLGPNIQFYEEIVAKIAMNFLAKIVHFSDGFLTKIGHFSDGFLAKMLP